MTSVVLADDHALVRQGIRALLERAGDVQILGEASNGQEAVELVEKLEPDVLLIDLAMPRLNGLDAIERINANHSRTRVIVVSIYADEVLIIRALRAGARGYLPKDSFKEELYQAVRTVARGEVYLSSKVAETVLNSLFSDLPDLTAVSPIERLSPREREVLQLILEGKTNRQIAQVLQISIKTVDKHRTSLMKKLGVHDVTALVHTASKYGMLYVR